MTERSLKAQSNQTPYHAHPMRDLLALELLMPSQTALIERVFDRIEKGAST